MPRKGKYRSGRYHLSLFNKPQYLEKTQSAYNPQEFEIALIDAKNRTEEISVLWNTLHLTMVQKCHKSIKHVIDLAGILAPQALESVTKKITYHQVSNLIHFGKVEALEHVVQLCNKQRHNVFENPGVYAEALYNAIRRRHIKVFGWLHKHHAGLIDVHRQGLEQLVRSEYNLHWYDFLNIIHNTDNHSKPKDVKYIVLYSSTQEGKDFLTGDSLLCGEDNRWIFQQCS